jgi:hypothetical protein
VISGFNTDVEFAGVVYHVQTEDKGLKSRLILTLVYDGGTILASKRTGYEDLGNGSLDPNALAERVQRQHQLICAAVRAGRLNDLKAMAARDRKAALKPVPEVAVQTSEVAVQDIPIAIPPGVLPHVQVALPDLATEPAVAGPTDERAPIVVPIEDIEAIPVYEIFDDGPLIDGVFIIEEDEILPAEAVAVVSELAGTSRPANTKLGVEILGESKFKSGDRKTVNIMICRGTERKVIGEAEIMVKVLGSSFRPVIYHVRSDKNGLAKVHLQVPQFNTGRAALLIRARSEGDEAELRKIVLPAN